VKQEEKNLPLSTVALLFGGLSIPLAFTRHLCSLAIVIGVYAMVFGFWGQRRAAKHLLRYTGKSVKRATIGARLALVGTICAILMWILWATNWLLT